MDWDVDSSAALLGASARDGGGRWRGLDSRALNQAFAVVTYSRDGKVRAANYQFLRLFGCNLGELLGQEVGRLLSASDTGDLLADLWPRLASGQHHREIRLWNAAGGREVWLESRFVPVLDASGQVEAIVQIAEDISSRLEQETELRGQIQAVQSIHAVAHFAPDGRVLWVNDAYLAVTGYERAELLQSTHELFVPPERRGQQGADAFWARLLAGEHESGDYWRLGKGGKDLWLKAVYVPILDPAGRTTKIVQYALDITAQKLRHADYASQVKAIHRSNCVVTFDMHGCIVDANELFLEATGYSRQELLGRHHRMFVEPSHAHSADYATFWSELRRGRHQMGLYPRIAKGGREIWLQASYNPLLNAAGKPVKVVKYATVVTEQRLRQAEQQGQIAAINNAQCVISFDLDGRVLDANENFLRATGYRFSEVLGQHHRQFVSPAVADSEDYRSFWRGLAQGEQRSGEFRQVAKGGREIWLQAGYHPIRDLNGRISKVVMYATDVTEAKLRQADDQRQIEAIHKSQDVVVFALDGTILDANPRFLATVGYAREELVGQHHAMLVEREVAGSADYQGFWSELRAGQHHEGLFKRIGKGGKEIWIQSSYNPIPDLNGRPFKVLTFATDVSANIALAEAFAESKRLAQLDIATSLPNRAKLTSFLGTYLADATGTLALFYVDVDHFSQVNEQHGHLAGDRLLAELADRMRRLLRADQMAARVGGDEFVIAAPGMGAEAVERFCRVLLDKLAEPILVVESEEVRVSVSIGVALAPADGSTPDDLLRAGDTALATSKRNGRGCRSYFSDELNAKLYGQRKLIEDMRNSLVAGDFYLEFQPRFDTVSRRVRSVETLVRWCHHERGRIGPAEFIPLAEQCGLIVPLGEWILNQACAATAAWPGLGVSVNLSPVQFGDDDLVRKISEALQRSGLPAHRLELEITEGVLLADSQRALEVLGALKQLGVKLAIDDFGTGYSSLSYLRKFPFNVIKVDRSFVRDLTTSDSSRPIVQAILALGRALGLSVTAEGVETQEQLDLLQEDGCDEVQGFLLAMPASSLEITRLLAHQSAAQPAA